MLCQKRFHTIGVGWREELHDNDDDFWSYWFVDVVDDFICVIHLIAFCEVKFIKFMTLLHNLYLSIISYSYFPLNWII